MDSKGKACSCLATVPLQCSPFPWVGNGERNEIHEVVGRGCSHISCSEALHLNASAGPQDLISLLQDNKAAVLFSLPDNYYLFFPIVFRIYMLFSFEEQSLCYLPFFCPDYFFVEQLMRGSSAQHMQSCLFPFESTMDVF